MVEELLLVVVVVGFGCSCWGGINGCGGGGSRMVTSSWDCCSNQMNCLLHCIHCLMMWVGLRRSWSMDGLNMYCLCGGSSSPIAYSFAASSLTCCSDMFSMSSCVVVAVSHRSLHRR